MSEKTVHWPTADGSADLDFSAPKVDGAGAPASQAASTPNTAASSVPSAPSAPTASEKPAVARDAGNRDAAAAWAWAPLGGGQATASGAAAGVPAGDARSAIEIAAEAGARRSTAAEAPTAVTVEPMPATRSRLGSRRTRKARLRIARIDPWSVMKTSFLFSIAFGIILMVISWVLWTVLAGSGALESVNHFVTTLIGDQEGQQFDITQWINGSRVLGLSALLAAVDVVILTAVATLFAFLYNLAATVIGGLEVTLAED